MDFTMPYSYGYSLKKKKNCWERHSMSRELALAAGNQTPRAPPPRLCAPPSSLCTHSLWPLPSVQSPWECRKYIMSIRFKSNTRGLPNTRQEVNISSQKYGWCFFWCFFLHFATSDFHRAFNMFQQNQMWGMSIFCRHPKESATALARATCLPAARKMKIHLCRDIRFFFK